MSTYNKLKNEQMPWTEKYKPRLISELNIDASLKTKIEAFGKTKVYPNLIFAGLSGVGKTAAIRCLAFHLFGNYIQHGMMEINSSNGSVKTIHDIIITFCRNKLIYQKSDINKYSKFKLVIIDGLDNMDINKIQSQINNIMETYKNTVKFAFTCNITSNIIESIQSRCLILNCGLLSSKLIFEKLKSISNEEKITIEKPALKQISIICKGDIRKSINMLQLISNNYDEIKTNHVNQLCFLPQHMLIKNLFDTIIKKNLKNSIKIVTELKQSGYSGLDITLGMIHTLKLDICNDIDEKCKNEMLLKISIAVYYISKHIDSYLQLLACIVDMVNSI
jgi:replication factor C subunit 2/4